MVAELKWRLRGLVGMDSLLINSLLKTMSVLLAFRTTCSISITWVYTYNDTGIKYIDQHMVLYIIIF